LKKQVEERLEFYSSGAQPMKNEVAMVGSLVPMSMVELTFFLQKNAMDKVLADMDIDEPSKADAEMFDAEPAAVQKQEKKQKDKEGKEKKKDKKRKSDGADVVVEEKKKKRKSMDTVTEVSEKKKKKKSKSE
jgi:nucleolar protein 56